MKLSPGQGGKSSRVMEVQGNGTLQATTTDADALRATGTQASNPVSAGGESGEGSREAREAARYSERLDAVDARIDALDGRIDAVDARVSIALSMHDDASGNDSEPTSDDSDTDLDIDRLDAIEEVLDGKVNDAEFVELSDKVDNISMALDSLVEMVSGRFDDTKARSDKRLTAIENQVIDDSKALDKLSDNVAALAKLSERVDKLQHIIEELAAPDPEPEEPEPEPEPIAPVKPSCPECGSFDGWPLENTYSNAKQWYCRKCSRIIDVPVPVKAKGNR